MESMSSILASSLDRHDAAIDAPPMVGVDERRMQVRAYNIWSGLLGSRQWPSIADLDVAVLEFGSNAILLDFTAGVTDPGIVYMGERLRAESELSGDVRTISAVPRGSVISRLTDHYLQILANGTPIGFEAEYVNAAGAEILYRGILLPFSTDDETIDFILGVLNWKQAAPLSEESELQHSMAHALRSPPVSPVVGAWADGPQSRLLENVETLGDEPAGDPAPGAWDGLHGRLADARIFADQARDAEGRTHSALYRAISKTWDFAMAAAEQPDTLAALLADAGLKAQQCSPFTPIVKLVFGATCDKSRVAEYSAILGHARDEGMAAGTLASYLGGYDGGLKALLKHIRSQRRVDAPPVRRETPQLAALRQAAPAAMIRHDAGAAEFVVLIGRAMGDGQIAVIACAEEDDALIGRLAKKAKPLL